jgi:hypothetical protein
MSRVQLPPECIYEILKRTQEGAPYDLPSRRVSFFLNSPFSSRESELTLLLATGHSRERFPSLQALD